MALTYRVELSLSAWHLAWQQAGLGRPPLSLTFPPQGPTATERDELAREATAELADAGLVSGGRVCADLLDSLTLLAQGAPRIFGWFSPDGVVGQSLVVTASESEGVVAVSNECRMVLTPIEPLDLVHTSALVLPDLPGFDTRSVTAPLAAVRSAERGRTTGGREGDAARTLLALLRQPRRGGGQVHGSVGAERPTSPSVSYVDTEDGRILLRVSTGSDRRQWITAVSGSVAAVTDQFGRLLTG